jgi:hypothetical protein
VSSSRTPRSLLTGDLPRAPTSLLAGALPPSLLQGERDSSHVPSRPRSLWAVQDTSLRSIPKFYPPLDPNCTAYVGDASPSVVAIRIAECLRKRSIAVEYDEEAVSNCSLSIYIWNRRGAIYIYIYIRIDGWIDWNSFTFRFLTRTIPLILLFQGTATAMTVDRCHFVVQLWKSNVTGGVDFSHGVVVECMRMRGSTMSFHHACRAILQAALGQSTGEDQRPLRATNGLEFASLQDDGAGPSTSSLNVSAAHALEQARELLYKDRLDTQLLGMERLVHLTCASICGTDICLHVSVQVLQEEWLLEYVFLEEDEERGDAAQNSPMLESTIGAVVTPDEGRHESKMRACALRVLCNALTNVSQAKLLPRILESDATPPLIQCALLNSLVADLQGANRPPSAIEAGTKLASVHEAALAVRILRLLGEQSSTVKDFWESEHVLERLELARIFGRGTHLVLQQEAERTYAKLTEDVRSC